MTPTPHSFSAGTGSSRNTPRYAGETSRGQRNKLDLSVGLGQHSSIIFQLDELLTWLTLPHGEGT